MPKYQIEDFQLNSMYFDDSDRRSYRLDTFGNDIEELLKNASVVVLAWDGVELWKDRVLDCSDDVIYYVQKVIKRELKV